ncbi:MAG: hypothetical protein ACRDFQ_04590 [Anaerolineales bacterium]
MEKTRKQVKKVDGVIEAAHFDSQGRLAWVRAYERRGPTWSDIVLLDRPTLIQRLKAGKRFYVGTRREFWASEFDLGERLRLVQSGVKPILVLGKGGARQDTLEGMPVV